MQGDKLNEPQISQSRLRADLLDENRHLNAATLPSSVREAPCCLPEIEAP